MNPLRVEERLSVLRLGCFLFVCLCSFSIFIGVAPPVDATTTSNDQLELTATQEDAEAVNYVMSDGRERSLFYAGESIIVVGTPIDAAYNAGEDFVTLRRVESADGGEITNSRPESTLEIEDDFTEIPANASDIETPSGERPVAFVRIEDEQLDAGDYFVRDTERRVAETEVNSIEIVIQRFDAAWVEESIEIGENEPSFELELDSQRSSYNVNVSADGLEYEELASLFLDPNNEADERLETNAPRTNREPFEDASGSPFRGEGLDARLEKASAYEDEDVIVLRGYSNDALVANFTNTDVDSATYNFELSVVDSGVETTAPLTVEDADADAEFDASVYQRAAGDILDITVELEDTDETYLVFGNRQAEYLDVVYLEDETGDGYVEFTVNTRLIGTQPRSNAAGGDDAFTSDADTVVSLAATDNQAMPATVDEVFEGIRLEADSEALATTENSVPGADGSLNALRDELDIRPLVRPIQPSTYEMRLTTGGVIGLSEAGDIRVDGEHDFALVDLEEPQLEAATAYTAPAARGDSAGIDAVRGQMASRDTIAIGDRLIFETEASGYVGHTLASEYDNGVSARSVFENGTTTQGLHRLDADPTDGITFVVESDTVAANQDPKRLELNTDDTESMKAFVDPDTQNLLVVIDTRQDVFDRQITDGDLVSLRMAYETSDDKRYRFAETVSRGDFDTFEPFSGSAGGIGERGTYPYFQTGKEEAIEAEITFESPEVEFDRTTAGSNDVRLGQSPDAVVSGSTNLAAGTTLELRVFSQGEPPIAEVVETDVQSDGSFAAEIDTADGDTGQIIGLEVRYNGQTVDERRGILTDDRAAISFEDQRGSEAVDTVGADAFAPEGGFVAVYNESFLTDGSAEHFRGVSEYLTSGANFDVEVQLDEPIANDSSVVAVLHRDTNENREFDFIESSGHEDGPYLAPDGEPIVDEAEITVVEPTPTPESESQTPTDTPVATPTPATETPGPEPVDQMWHSWIPALIAMVVAMLCMAFRKR